MADDDMILRLDVDLNDALEATADAVGSAVGRAVIPLLQTIQESRDGTAVLLDRYAEVYAALAAVVALLDRGSVRGNWAPDQAILDTARDLVNRLAPTPLNGADDGEPPRT